MANRYRSCVQVEFPFNEDNITCFGKGKKIRWKGGVSEKLGMALGQIASERM